MAINGWNKIPSKPISLNDDLLLLRQKLTAKGNDIKTNEIPLIDFKKEESVNTLRILIENYQSGKFSL